MGTPKRSSSGVHVKQEAKIHYAGKTVATSEGFTCVMEQGLRASTKSGYRRNKIRKTQYSPVWTKRNESQELSTKHPSARLGLRLHTGTDIRRVSRHRRDRGGDPVPGRPDRSRSACSGRIWTLPHLGNRSHRTGSPTRTPPRARRFITSDS